MVLNKLYQLSEIGSKKLPAPIWQNLARNFIYGICVKSGPKAKNEGLQFYYAATLLSKTKFPM